MVKLLLQMSIFEMVIFQVDVFQVNVYEFDSKCQFKSSL